MTALSLPDTHTHSYTPHTDVITSQTLKSYLNLSASFPGKTASFITVGMQGMGGVCAREKERERDRGKLTSCLIIPTAIYIHHSVLAAH